jgi:hypothetical protein
MHSVLEILEESTASAGPDLISLSDLKFALGITDNSEDAQLKAAITFQSEIIAEYLDRRLGRAEALETFTFDWGEMFQHYQVPALRGQALTLSLYPVFQVHEVSHMGATDTDFDFDPISGRLWIGPTWTVGSTWPEKVIVTYSGGYDLPEDPLLPKRLQRAVIECVNSVRNNQSFGLRDPSIREVQHGDTRVSYVSQSFAAGTTAQHLTPSVIDLIKPFRRIGIA